MKKNSIYIVVALVAGLLAGYLIFGSGGEDHNHQASGEEAAPTMYTCSMHPQIVQPEPGDCPICGMDLIPAEAGADGLASNQFKMTEHAIALANIQTTIAGQGNTSAKGITLSGKLMANEETTMVQASYFKGRIENLYVNTTGEEVRKGTRLATIYAPELVAAQQELLTTSRIKASQPELYQAVRRKLKLWKLSDKQIDAIENSGEVKEYFPVYANIGGTVTQKLVEEGDYVTAGQPLFKVANLNSVWAVFDAYEKQLPLLQEGQNVEISTNAFPGRKFEGAIDFINPVMNTGSRTTDVRVILNNAAGTLKPGMFVKGSVQVSAGETGISLTIPKSAVMWTGKRSVVYVKPDPSQPVFELREIEIGSETGDEYEVLAGLKEGDHVVTQGTFTVDAAAQLQSKPSMMNRETKEDEAAMAMITLPESFQDALWPLFNEYMAMNEQFVATNANGVKKQAGALLKTYESLDTSVLGKEEADMVKKAGQMITTIANSEDIEGQRAHLVILSDILVALARNMEHLPETLYVQNCPMANQNKGAHWLSTDEKILNPYYGDMMLNCGSVTDTLKAK